MIRLDEVTDINSALDKVVLGNSYDFIRKLPDSSIDTVVTSPPYWQQRDYGCDGQYGLEVTFQEYIEKLFVLFEEIKRVLKADGTAWINLGDCFNENSGGYFSHQNNDAPHVGKHRLKSEKYQKDFPRRSLLLLPYRFAIKMTDDGNWVCRNVVIWKKKIAQPTSAENRFTIDYEPVFLFAKRSKYYFNKSSVKWIENTNGDLFAESVSRKERRSVWDLDSDHRGGTGHKAPYPIDLALIPILASCPPDGIVFDPFLGSGTTAVAAKSLGRHFLGCDLSEEYCRMADTRLSQTKLKVF